MPCSYKGVAVVVHTLQKSICVAVRSSMSGAVHFAWSLGFLELRVAVSASVAEAGLECMTRTGDWLIWMIQRH
jgi:hypothetical protein